MSRKIRYDYEESYSFARAELGLFAPFDVWSWFSFS